MKVNYANETQGSRFLQMIIAAIIVLVIGIFFFQNTTVYFRDDPDPPLSIHLNKEDIYLVKGEEFKLRVYAINKRVTYTSSNFRVAGVNFNGRIMAYQTGKAYITAEVGNEKKLRCRVHVIDLNKKRLKLRVGETYRLKLRGSNAWVRWRSSNPAVAKINLFGKIKAKKPGSTIITARVKGKVIRCTVRVN